MNIWTVYNYGAGEYQNKEKFLAIKSKKFKSYHILVEVAKYHSFTIDGFNRLVFINDVVGTKSQISRIEARQQQHNYGHKHNSSATKGWFKSSNSLVAATTFRLKQTENKGNRLAASLLDVEMA